MINQAIHTLDMVRWFIDSDVDTVAAHIANRTLQDVIEVEDEAGGLIRFKNGVKLHFSACNYYCCNAPVEIELRCEKALIQILGDRAVYSLQRWTRMDCRKQSKRNLPLWSRCERVLGRQPYKADP